MESKLPRIDAPREIICDFDGTVVYHDWPFIGEENEGCVKVLKKLVQAGHVLILLTMRTDHLLDEAVEWFKVRDIPLTFINRNENYETGSRKVYAHISIDDHGLGIPLIYDTEYHKKPFVDWKAVDKILEARGYYVKQYVAKEPV